MMKSNISKIYMPTKIYVNLPKLKLMNYLTTELTLVLTWKNVTKILNPEIMMLLSLNITSTLKLTVLNTETLTTMEKTANNSPSTKQLNVNKIVKTVNSIVVSILTLNVIMTLNNIETTGTLIALVRVKTSNLKLKELFTLMMVSKLNILSL